MNNTIKLLLLIYIHIFSDPKDGSRLVYKVVSKTNTKIEFVKTENIPTSIYYREVFYKTPIPGSIIWWNEYMGIFDPIAKGVITDDGFASLESLIEKYGKPRFFLTNKESKIDSLKSNNLAN